MKRYRYKLFLSSVNHFYLKQKRYIVTGFVILVLVLPVTLYLSLTRSKFTSNAQSGTNEIKQKSVLRTWLFMADQKSALSTMEIQNPQLIHVIFNKHNTYVLQEPGQKPVYPGIPVARYRSFKDFQSDIKHHVINSSIHWVLYDNEKWTYTPLIEQENPLYYEMSFAILAHKNGYKVILAPAQDLVPGFVTHSLAWHEYLSMGLANVSAQYGDIYEIQAQPYEAPPYNTTNNFTQFIQAAVKQARSVNPKIVILAGVSTHRVVTAQQLASDMLNTKPYVQGFWFNVPTKPGPSKQNPAQLGVDAISQLVKETAIITPSPTGSQKQSSGKYSWMINAHAVQLINQQGKNAQTLVQLYFNNQHTFLLGNTNSVQNELPQAQRTITFTSYAQMKKAFATNAVARDVKAVVYDNENWQFTPRNEQQQVGYYYALAANLVHSHHLIFIATPATDLVNTLDPGGTNNKYDEFIALGIPKAAAKFADIYEIQAQGSENNTKLYAKFVKEATQQALAANPKVAVYAGLSTNPSGQRVTGEQLYQAVKQTQSDVMGYWLNIPSGGSYCPKCGTAQPQVALELLSLLNQ